jgi:hypothetical protein
MSRIPHTFITRVMQNECENFPEELKDLLKQFRTFFCSMQDMSLLCLVIHECIPDYIYSHIQLRETKL